MTTTKPALPEPVPPNAEGSTTCIVRWMVTTRDGLWLGAWDKEAFAAYTQSAIDAAVAQYEQGADVEARLGDEARAEVKRLRAALSEQPEASDWAGEEWERLAWHLCAEESGEEACNELVWEGGPIPEPWGDRWMKYEGEAKRMIAMVRQHVAHSAPVERVTLSDEQIRQCADVAHGRGPNTVGVVSDFALKFARAVIAEYERAMLSAAPKPEDTK